jgi:replicative DNA helicase
MDSAVRLVSRVLIDKDVDSALKRDITDKMFGPDEYRDAFRFICSHMNKYSVVPSATTVKAEYPSLRLVKVEDDMDVVIDQFMEEHRKVVAKTAITEAVEAMQRRRWDADDVLDVLHRAMADLEGTVGGTSVINLMDPATVDEELHDYDVLEARAGSLLGIPTGFPTIDAATLGLQKQQLVTIVAAPKTGKSQLAMRIAQTVWENGFSPAFLSFEMSNDEQRRRRASMAYGLSHTRLMNGDLVAPEKKRYVTGRQAEKNKHPFHLLDSGTGMTVSAVAAKARSLNPDVLFIDGVYLMIDEQTGEHGTPQSITNITRSLKRLAQKLNIPIVISTQTLTWKMKKNKLDPNAIGYSSSFYQDSDVIFGLERGDEDMGDNYRLLKVLASRNTGSAEVDLDWDWNSGVFQEVTNVSYGLTP